MTGLSPVQRLVEKSRLKGMGDVVAVVAKPIARAVDAVAGTKLAQCGGCAKRQESLNRAMPFELVKPRSGS